MGQPPHGGCDASEDASHILFPGRRKVTQVYFSTDTMLAHGYNLTVAERPPFEIVDLAYRQGVRSYSIHS